MTVVQRTDRRARARETLDRAVEHLLALREPDGHWKGELETNVTIDSEDLFLRHYLGILEPALAADTARWIRSKQREDGSWATFYEGPPDVSTTVEAYVALRLAGDAPDDEHMERARASILAGGGVEVTRVFTRMWLSLLGLWRWQDVPLLPPEQILLPPRAPLSVYTFGCWARQTIVALQIVTALRPSRAVEFAIGEILTGVEPPKPKLDVWGRFFAGVDRALHLYHRVAFPPLRRYALGVAERWVVDRQEADGSWGGIQPPWVWSLIGLAARGYPLDHPVIAKGLAGLDSFTIADEQGRRLEACQSPVWDTALAVIALLDAGLPPEHGAVSRAAEWLVSREVRVRGDWSVRKPDLEPGGFPFEYANDNYPDVDDTAEVVLALRRAGVGADAADRGVAWMLGMQSRSGGWGAFDVDNESGLCNKIPFCDFGAVTDPPSSDVTAHVLEALALEGRGESGPARAGLAWLLAEQEEDGSWFGRWGANHVYGTSAALLALEALGLRDHPAVGRAVAWLDRIQNEDGGFGEDLRSYREPEWRGRGASTASQTAWALLGYHAAGAHRESAHREAVDRAIEFLASTQRADGGWDEPFFTGTGFPCDFYLNYHLYRDVFPTMALARLLREEP